MAMGESAAPEPVSVAGVAVVRGVGDMVSGVPLQEASEIQFL